eukprot:scaffold252148_cov21-Tisochrysis_lutea.AAC.1
MFLEGSGLCLLRGIFLHANKVRPIYLGAKVHMEKPWVRGQQGSAQEPSLMAPNSIKRERNATDWDSSRAAVHAGLKQAL